MRCFSLELRSAGGEPNSTTASISDKQHRCIAGSRGNRRQNLIDSEVSIGIEGYWIRAVGCGRFGVAAEQSGENACSSVGVMRRTNILAARTRRIASKLEIFLVRRI